MNVDPFQKHFELNMNVVLLTIINPIINKKQKPQIQTPVNLNIKNALLSIINTRLIKNLDSNFNHYSLIKKHLS